MSIHSEQDLIKQQLANLNDKINEAYCSLASLQIEKKRLLTECKSECDDEPTLIATTKFIDVLIDDNLISEWRSMFDMNITSSMHMWTQLNMRKCEKIIAVCNLIPGVTVTAAFIKIKNATICVSIEKSNGCNSKNNKELYRFLVELNKRANTTNVAIYPDE